MHRYLDTSVHIIFLLLLKIKRSNKREIKVSKINYKIKSKTI